MRKYEMQKHLVLMCISAILSACGEFSYKRGATGKDLADTRKLCQAEALKTDTEVNECLKKNGWTVHQLNDLDLFAVASVTSNKQNGSASEDFPSLETVKPENTTPETTNAREAIAAKPSSTETAAPEATKPSTKNSSTKNPSTKDQVKSANPLDIYSISSWWKMGSSRATLDADMQSCETELGEAHKPDHINQKFTLGMIVCMHQKGWKALKK